MALAVGFSQQAEPSAQVDPSPQAEPSAQGVEIAGVVWARCNLDAPGHFAATPEDVGMLYRWNSRVGWSAQNPIRATNGSTVWVVEDPAPSDVLAWGPENDPCPEGWRVPTAEEFDKLCDLEQVAN